MKGKNHLCVQFFGSPQYFRNGQLQYDSKRLIAPLTSHGPAGLGTLPLRRISQAVRLIAFAIFRLTPLTQWPLYIYRATADHGPNAGR